jgi:Zn-dependent M28 family amino/carboxypeptidase
MNEENGLRGGRGYWRAHQAEMARHIAAIESDAGAAPPTGFVTTVKGEKLLGLQRRLGVLQRIGALRFETTDEETGADTSPMVEGGVPGFGLIPDPRHYFDYHHSAADTLDKVAPDDLAANTAALAALAWVIADSPESLR